MTPEFAEEPKDAELLNSMFQILLSHLESYRNMKASIYYYRPQTKLGQGNIFRSVCQEFCSHPGAVHAGRYGQQAGGTHPTGMHTCVI